MTSIFIVALMGIIQYQLYRSFRNSLCGYIERAFKNKDTMSGNRNKRKLIENIPDISQIIISVLTIIAVIALIYSMGGYDRLGIRSQLIMGICTALLCVSGSNEGVEWHKNLAVSCIYTGIMAGAVIITNRLFDYSGIYSTMLRNTKIEFISPCIVFISAITVILFGIYNSERQTELDKQAGYALMFTAMAQLAVIIYINNIYAEVSDSKSCLIIIVFICIVKNVLMIFIINMDEDIRHSYEEDILKIEIETNNKLYDNIIEAKEELRDIRHDLKNRLNVLSYAVELGDYETAKKELGSLLDNINSAGRPDYCDNLKVNSIFTYKLSDVPENVTVDCVIDVPPVMDIDYGDMNVLIGNLIDNSINAVKRVKNSGNAYIDMNLTCSAGNLIFIIKNSYNDDKEVRGKDYYINHGRGIGSVKKILKKYNGIYEIQKTDNEYETYITAPMYKVQNNENRQ